MAAWDTAIARSPSLARRRRRLARRRASSASGTPGSREAEVGGAARRRRLRRQRARRLPGAAGRRHDGAGRVRPGRRRALAAADYAVDAAVAVRRRARLPGLGLPGGGPADRRRRRRRSTSWPGATPDAQRRGGGPVWQGDGPSRCGRSASVGWSTSSRPSRAARRGDGPPRSVGVDRADVADGAAPSASPDRAARSPACRARSTAAGGRPMRRHRTPTAGPSCRSRPTSRRCEVTRRRRRAPASPSSPRGRSAWPMAGPADAAASTARVPPPPTTTTTTTTTDDHDASPPTTTTTTARRPRPPPTTTTTTTTTVARRPRPRPPRRPRATTTTDHHDHDRARRRRTVRDVPPTLPPTGGGGRGVARVGAVAVRRRRRWPCSSPRRGGGLSGRGEQAQDVVVGGRREVGVPLPDGDEVGRLAAGTRRRRPPSPARRSVRRADGHGDDDAARAGRCARRARRPASSPRSPGRRRRARRRARRGRARAVAAQAALLGGELRAGDGQRARSTARPRSPRWAIDVVVAHDQPARRDGADRQLVVARRADLAHGQHVERGRRGGGHRRGDRHAAARQAEHDHVVGGRGAERSTRRRRPARAPASARSRNRRDRMLSMETRRG